MKRVILLLVFASIYVQSLPNLEQCIKDCTDSYKKEEIYIVSDLIRKEGNEIFEWFKEYACDHHTRNIFYEYIERNPPIIMMDKKEILNNIFKPEKMNLPKNNLFRPFDMFINYVGLKYECFLTINSTLFLDTFFTCQPGVHQLYTLESYGQYKYESYSHHICQNLNHWSRACKFKVTDIYSKEHCVTISNIYGVYKSYKRFAMEQAGLIPDDYD